MRNAAALVAAAAASVMLVAQDAEMQRLLGEAASRNIAGRNRREPVLLSILFAEKKDERNESTTARAVLDAVQLHLAPVCACRIELHIRDGLTTDVLNAARVSWGLSDNIALGQLSVMPASGVKADDPSVLSKVSHALNVAGVTHYEYEGSRHMYTDYGEYVGEATQGWDPQRKRTWKVGERSPFVVTTAFISKRGFDTLTVMEWAEKQWFPVQSPMSEMMQPRARYVRNVLTRPISPKAPKVDGVVFEAWPSSYHLDNVFAFFNADGPFSLIRNIIIMLRGVSTFTEISAVSTSQYGEYIFY